MSAWTYHDYARVPGRNRRLLFDRIKTVSKRDPFSSWDLPLSEEQTPHIVEKPKNRRDAMEPKEASCGLPAQAPACTNQGPSSFPLAATGPRLLMNRFVLR
jgi:hypothetical protein